MSKNILLPDQLISQNAREKLYSVIGLIPQCETIYSNKTSLPLWDWSISGFMLKNINEIIHKTQS